MEADTPYEKRRQLEKKIQLDTEELETLQSSLLKTNAFTSKVVCHL